MSVMIWSLIVISTICGKSFAGPVDQRTIRAEPEFQGINPTLRDLSMENDLFNLANSRGQNAETLREQEMKIEDEDSMLQLELNESFENAIDVDEAHIKVKRFISRERNEERFAVVSEDKDQVLVKRELPIEDDVLSNYDNDEEMVELRVYSVEGQVDDSYDVLGEN